MKLYSVVLSTPLMISTLLTLSGCATKSLLTSGATAQTTQVRHTLLEDHVLAFGKPAVRLANMPTDAVVIVGQKNSYVLTEGGSTFERLIGKLDPRYVTLSDSLDFYSANNDGRFTGKLSLKYRQLENQITDNDRKFFLQHGVSDCTTSNDRELGAKGFCFNIALQGVIYPAVSNQSSLKALSKAYPVTIYTKKSEIKYQTGDKNAVEQVILLPFAVAFDVVTLPFQALGKIFD